MSKCGYSLDDYKCTLDVFRDGFCLFHLPKPSKAKLNQTTNEQRIFWSQVSSKFTEDFQAFFHDIETSTDVNTIEISGFIFPDSFFQGDTNKPIKFIGCHFVGVSNFDHFVFEQNVLFASTTFEEESTFVQTRFEGDVHFSTCIFKHSARFHASVFKQKCFFLDSYFNFVDFSGSEFYSYCSFSSEFRIAEYSSCLFEEKVSFRNSKFTERLYFKNPYSDADIFFGRKIAEEKPINLDFCEVKIGKNCYSVFEDIDLSKTHFMDTEKFDLIEFKNSKWFKPSGVLGLYRGNALWDEFSTAVLLRAPTPEQLSMMYHKLVIYYDRIREFNISEDFHISEMEMRRKMVSNSVKSRLGKKIREIFNFHTLYLILSRYGSSYTQSLIVFILLAVISSTFILIFGVNEYCSIANTTTALKLNISNMFKLFNFIISSMLPGVSKNSFLFTYPSSIILNISKILLLGQTSLLIFAIRRRFKR